MKKMYVTALAVLLSLGVYAQEAPKQAVVDEDLKQANNPLATIKTVNFHNYYMPNLYGAPDATYNQAWVRYAQPIGSFIIRASLPFVVQSFPEQGQSSGLSDLNIFGIYKFKVKKPGLDVGIGPALTLPTGTSGLGSGKWQAGLSAIAFAHGSPTIQIGALLTWQMSFAGDSDRDDVNMLTPQIFFMWQVGGGTYLRSTGIWTFDLESGNYNVPIGLGIGKAFKSGKKVFNIFMEPQYSVLSQGVGQPKFQIFVGFNTQFR